MSMQRAPIPLCRQYMRQDSRCMYPLTYPPVDAVLCHAMSFVTKLVLQLACCLTFPVKAASFVMFVWHTIANVYVVALIYQRAFEGNFDSQAYHDLAMIRNMTFSSPPSPSNLL